VVGGDVASPGLKVGVGVGLGIGAREEGQGSIEGQSQQADTDPPGVLGVDISVAPCRWFLAPHRSCKQPEGNVSHPHVVTGASPPRCPARLLPPHLVERVRATTG
jgi:hypothetical protein